MSLFRFLCGGNQSFFAQCTQTNESITCLHLCSDRMLHCFSWTNEKRNREREPFLTCLLLFRWRCLSTEWNPLQRCWPWTQMCSEILDVRWWSVRHWGKKKRFRLSLPTGCSDCDDGSDEEQRYCGKQSTVVWCRGFDVFRECRTASSSTILQTQWISMLWLQRIQLESSLYSTIISMRWLQWLSWPLGWNRLWYVETLCGSRVYWMTAHCSSS